MSNRAYAATLRTRVKTTTKLVRKLGRLPITFKNKAYIVRTKALSKALYGCEASLLHPADQMGLATVIKHAVSKTSTHMSADLTFATSSHGSDVDPETVILTRRVTMLRRMLSKRPRLKMQVGKFSGNTRMPLTWGRSWRPSPTAQLRLHRYQDIQAGTSGNHTSAPSVQWVSYWSISTKKQPPYPQSWTSSARMPLTYLFYIARCKQ